MQIRIGNKGYKPSQIRKAIAAGAGLVIEFGNQAIETLADTPPEVHTVITGIVGVATLIAVFAIRNAEVIDAADNL